MTNASVKCCVAHKRELRSFLSNSIRKARLHRRNIFILFSEQAKENGAGLSQAGKAVRA